MFTLQKATSDDQKSWDKICEDYLFLGLPGNDILFDMLVVSVKGGLGLAKDNLPYIHDDDGIFLITFEYDQPNNVFASNIDKEMNKEWEAIKEIIIAVYRDIHIFSSNLLQPKGVKIVEKGVFQSSVIVPVYSLDYKKKPYALGILGFMSKKVIKENLLLEKLEELTHLEASLALGKTAATPIFLDVDSMLKKSPYVSPYNEKLKDILPLKVA
jgi:hypothetical protein